MNEIDKAINELDKSDIELLKYTQSLAINEINSRAKDDEQREKVDRVIDAIFECAKGRIIELLDIKDGQ